MKPGDRLKDRHRVYCLKGLFPAKPENVVPYQSFATQLVSQIDW